MYNLSAFIENVVGIVESHRLESPGSYARWLWQDDTKSRELGINPYGCADAANILYSVGRFPSQAAERAAWVGTLQSMQNPESGLFHEATHHDIHCTAHCIAALELFEARPLHSLTALTPLLAPRGIEGFLDGLDWDTLPWSESHQGAGAYAALVIAGEVTAEWEERYFAWLWEHVDPQTGFWRRGCVRPIPHAGYMTSFPHLAGSFHYLFNHEAAHRPLRYPERMIDSCLDMMTNDSFPIGEDVGFAEIDWIYCLTRAQRQSAHRFDEARAALVDFSSHYLPWLCSLDPVSDDRLNDLHQLFGMLCAVAELQQALPGSIVTSRPLRLVLDRRPFI